MVEQRDKPGTHPYSDIEVRRLCRTCASSGQFSLTESAHVSARREGYSLSDVRNALSSAERVTLADDAEYNVVGRSLDGAEIALLIVIEGGMLTVLSINRGSS